MFNSSVHHYSQKGKAGGKKGGVQKMKERKAEGEKSGKSKLKKMESLPDNHYARAGVGAQVCYHFRLCFLSLQ